MDNRINTGFGLIVIGLLSLVMISFAERLEESKKIVSSLKNQLENADIAARSKIDDCEDKLEELNKSWRSRFDSETENTKKFVDIQTKKATDSLLDQLVSQMVSEKRFEVKNKDANGIMHTYTFKMVEEK